jgi:hypothetical protein
MVQRLNTNTPLVIGDYDLQVYVPVPVAGAVPVTVLSRGDLELQAVWKDAGGNDITAGLNAFNVGEVYQADITINVKNGWSFDPGLNFQYPGSSVTTQPGPNLDPSLRALTTITYRAAEVAKTVDQADLSAYIPPPALGATPVISFGGVQYTGTVEWTGGAGINPIDLFQAGVIYTAMVNLTAAPGYVFGVNPGFYHTGDTLSPDPMSLAFTTNPGNSGGTLSIVFPQTRTGTSIDRPIDLTDLIPAPYAGGAPVTSFISPSMEYSGSVSWKDSYGAPLSGGVFQYGVTYRAEAVLTAAPGFVFPAGLTDVDFIHQYDDLGSPPVYIPGGGGMAAVTVTFEPTLNRIRVNNYNLEDYIPRPVAGELPIWTFDQTGVTGTISWDYYTPWGHTAVSALEVFHCNTIYRAEITLQAKTGYEFNPAEVFDYGPGLVNWGPDGDQSGTENRSITVVYQEFIGSFASENTRGSALKRVRAAKAEFTSVAAPLYIDISPGDESVSLISGSLETTGAVFDPSNSPAFVRIDGYGRKVQLTGSGTGRAVLTVKSGVTLYLRNLTLAGIGNNNAALITVDGGTLVLENGAVVEGNNSGSATWSAGGIQVINNGTLRLVGATAAIKNNRAYWACGGGVYNTGTFIMEAGKISGNTTFVTGHGAGVYNNTGGTFLMKNGEISGNTTSDTNSGFGGGVYNGGIFTMTDGKISGNTAGRGGGGMENEYGSFTMEGGEISGNTASYGGGIHNDFASFTMKGGNISGNTTIHYEGGGVLNSNRVTFIMEGGEISGNYAHTSGGGVYHVNGTFIKTGGTIYGGTGSSKNTSAYGQGHAVYLDSGKVRNADTGPGLLLYADRPQGGSWTYDDVGGLGDTTGNW